MQLETSIEIDFSVVVDVFGIAIIVVVVDWYHSADHPLMAGCKTVNVFSEKSTSILLKYHLVCWNCFYLFFIFWFWYLSF